jgi:hypothetical protein
LLAEPSVQVVCAGGPPQLKSVAIALRALVRVQRKASAPHGALLTALYRIALLAEFWPTLQHQYDYPHLLAPHVSLSDWQGDMPAFAESGYRHFKALGKTDVAWLVAEFGEPHAHLTPEQLWPDIRRNAYARYLWCEALAHAEQSLSEAQQRERVRQQLAQRLRSYLGIERANQARSQQPSAARVSALAVQITR